MPRQPRGRHQLLGCRPYGFSLFARSMAVASAKKVKRPIQNSKLHENPPSFSGNEYVNHTSRDKIKRSDSSDDEEFEEVQADFAFFDPKPNDFHGVKVLLQTYLDNKQWDLSGFVDLILGQTTVGTVVKIENDEDESVYAVVSALNLDRYKDQKCIMELKDFLLQSCLEKNVSSNLRSFLGKQAKVVGLLVSQRVLNLPPQLLPPLYDALFDEVSWATEDEPTEELRSSFRFKHFLVISKIYVHKQSNRKSGSSKSGNAAVIYIKPEDEILYELSSWSFNFPMLSQPVSTTNELKDYRLMGLVMAVEASKISTFRQQLKSFIDES